MFPFSLRLKTGSYLSRKEKATFHQPFFRLVNDDDCKRYMIGFLFPGVTL